MSATKHPPQASIAEVLLPASASSASHSHRLTPNTHHFHRRGRPSATSSPPPSLSPSPSPSPPRSRSSASSSTPSLNSHALAWDQTYLRITYLVRTMGPSSPALSAVSAAGGTPSHHQLSPAAAANSPAGTDPAPREGQGQGQGQAQGQTDGNTAAAAAEPAPRGWPLVPRDKVRRKVAQIATWRAEVAACGPRGTYCACSAASAPAPAPAPAPAVRAEGPSGPDRDVGPALGGDGGARECALCGRIPAPVLAGGGSGGWDGRGGGVRRALRGLVAGLRRRKGTNGAGGLGEPHRGPAGVGAGVGAGGSSVTLGEPAPRTDMYRADLPPIPEPAAGPLPAVAGGTSRREESGEGSGSLDGGCAPGKVNDRDADVDVDLDLDLDVDLDLDLDLDDLSGGSTKARGLLSPSQQQAEDMGARLARAHRLLARSHHHHRHPNYHYHQQQQQVGGPVGGKGIGGGGGAGAFLRAAAGGRSGFGKIR